ncbi:MAG TPA: molecular chaperone TorD [Sedimenticola thiotaurini]|uniref:Molecular chaperone TorD n=1 Tax=Sedimenticola thiotaurini TaxID=1543721 RepID=A0A831RJJ8_9GAMM|nr:molecular chaperone TorD [Sedimenticola thiotaurini]
MGGLLGLPGDESLPLLEELSRRHPWLAPAVAELSALPLDQWQGEYTRLFVNDRPRTRCPPFESAYRGGSMDGPAGTEVAALYRRAGLGAEAMPPDYLGTELECAAFLLERGETALLRELRREHLARWVPRFATDLREAAGLRLYRLLGERLALLFDGDGGAA